jgi:spermidine/putrescine transport system ATP-binding protein
MWWSAMNQDAMTNTQAPPRDEPSAPSAPSALSIELRAVRKTFGDVVAVDDVSLSVERGEFLTLLGPSGCGKTTTLRMIGGFELPTAGEIFIDGEEMGDRPPYRRPVNTVFQSYALFPHLSVGKNVSYGLEMSGVPRRDRSRRVAEVLDLVRLPHVEARKPAELSGGQQQRVALARALVNRPAVLLLDEPLGALDLKLRKAMQLELKRLNREVGATFVYVTHDQEEALTMSDRIAVMSDGLVLQLGTPEEIYERPRDRFVADFIGQTNFLEGRIVGTDGGFAAVDVPGVGVIRAVRSATSAAAIDVTIAIRPEKIAFAGDAPVPPDWNSLDGEIVETIYLGTHSHHVLRLTGGTSLTVHRQNRAFPGSHPEIGQRTRLTFAPSSATVLAE